uniref:Uncharacterized protein n=1 Tax=Candidatus Kentrum sp. DK TaxID=2126562 RepID=A0A450TDA3_9GAMM|nr:MAG: hypothetical protein BECKDK2373C_GA0170839_11239 [Candidatus Kentron sp. DK]
MALQDNSRIIFYKTVMRKDSITPKKQRSLASLRDKDFSLRSK